MKIIYIIDTIVIVAYLNANDEYHQWANNTIKTIPSGLLTCEPVLAETLFLFRKFKGGSDAVINFFEKAPVFIPFSIESERSQLHTLIKKYSNLPVSLADACLVRMSELYQDSAIITLDSDFEIYRKSNRQSISLIIP